MSQIQIIKEVQKFLSNPVIIEEKWSNVEKEFIINMVKERLQLRESTTLFSMQKYCWRLQ